MMMIIVSHAYPLQGEDSHRAGPLGRKGTQCQPYPQSLGTAGEKHVQIFSEKSNIFWEGNMSPHILNHRAQLVKGIQ